MNVPSCDWIKNWLENIVHHKRWHAGVNSLSAQISPVYHQRVTASFSSLLVVLLLGLEGHHMLQCWTIFTSRLLVFLSAFLPTAREKLVLSVLSPPPGPLTSHFTLHAVSLIEFFLPANLRWQRGHLTNLIFGVLAAPLRKCWKQGITVKCVSGEDKSPWTFNSRI